MNKPNLPSREAIQIELSRRSLEASLLAFTKWDFSEIKGTPFIENWHHKVICEYLEAVHREEIQFLLITIPPRYTKTEIAVKEFVKWSLAKNPRCKFIHLSYSDDLALDSSSEIKEDIAHEAFQRIWPLKLKKDSKSKKKWYTDAKGGLYATSTGGPITGFGAGSTADEGFQGAIIIDDPIKPDDVRSETIRKNINERFNTTIKSRLNNPSKTPIIVVMQRLHEEDPAGFLLDGGSEFKFTHLNLPAINEDGPSLDDPREIGEALWPAKHTVEQLKLMQEKSRSIYAGQYQQRPAPAEGGIIKKKWARYYEPHQLPKGGITSLSVDATFKGGKNNDFVALQVWKNFQADFYLLHAFRKQMGFTDTLERIGRILARFPECFEILVEDKANGSAIIEVLRKKFPGVIAITPKESKEARMQSVAPAWESGNVWLPEQAPFLENFENEIFLFPNAKHDDEADAMTQYINKKRIDSNYSLEAMLTM